MIFFSPNFLIVNKRQNDSDNRLFSNLFQVIRELTTKVDKLEASDAQRQQEGEQTEHKPMIIPEAQLMITAGPMGMVPQQYAPGYGAVPPGYPPQPGMPYPGYGM